MLSDSFIFNIFNIQSCYLQQRCLLYPKIQKNISFFVVIPVLLYVWNNVWDGYLTSESRNIYTGHFNRNTCTYCLLTNVPIQLVMWQQQRAYAHAITAHHFIFTTHISVGKNMISVSVTWLMGWDVHMQHYGELKQNSFSTINKQKKNIQWKAVLQVETLCWWEKSSKKSFCQQNYSSLDVFAPVCVKTKQNSITTFYFNIFISPIPLAVQKIFPQDEMSHKVHWIND